jgi:hypothetical protein
MEVPEIETISEALTTKLTFAIRNGYGDPSSPRLDLLEKITSTLQINGGNIYYLGRTRGGLPITEVVIALSSAGAFTAIYQIICKFLERHKDREITLERGKVKVTVKGHSLPEEKELLDALLTDEGRSSTSRKRLSR